MKVKIFSGGSYDGVGIEIQEFLNDGARVKHVTQSECLGSVAITIFYD